MALDITGELRPASRTLGLMRLGVGLAQGVILYVLYRTEQDHRWAAEWLWLFGGLLMAALVKPLVFIGGVGALRRNTLLIWTGAAGLIAFAIGACDVMRRATPIANFEPLPPLMAATGVLIFIAHHLVAAGDADRRLVARYPTYFDIAWKHGVQLALAGLFVGVFWAVMFLGAGLFKIIGIEALEKLIQKEWFAIPATTTMFAAAIQLTDIRVALIRGVRTVGLTLLAWLLPLMAVLAAAFLLALPFEGLKALWETNRATALLLSAAAVLIVLINSAYQEGKADAPPPIVVRWAARLGAIIIAPLVALAAYAVALRIGQHGLTPERVIGAACVLAGAFYAVGYLVAAVRPGPWLKTLEPTNVVSAWVAIVVLLSLMTPIADPARLSADDQLKRIERRAIPIDQIDYQFFRFRAGRYGIAALETLKAKGGLVGTRAAETLADKSPAEAFRPQATAQSRAAHITVYPKGAALPAGFLEQDWSRTPNAPRCLSAEEACDGYRMDLDGDGADEILLTVGYTVTAFGLGGDGHWEQVGTYTRYGCAALTEGLRAGKVTTVPTRWKELRIGAQQFRLADDGECIVAPPVVVAEPPKPPVTPNPSVKP